MHEATAYLRSWQLEVSKPNLWVCIVWRKNLNKSKIETTHVDVPFIWSALATLGRIFVEYKYNLAKVYPPNTGQGIDSLNKVATNSWDKKQNISWKHALKKASPGISMLVCELWVLFPDYFCGIASSK